LQPCGEAIRHWPKTIAQVNGRLKRRPSRIRTHLINGGEPDAQGFLSGSRRLSKAVSNVDTACEANEEPLKKNKQMAAGIYEMGS
jgi:hypothetical protein